MEGAVALVCVVVTDEDLEPGALTEILAEADADRVPKAERLTVTVEDEVREISPVRDKDDDTVGERDSRGERDEVELVVEDLELEVVPVEVLETVILFVEIDEAVEVLEVVADFVAVVDEVEVLEEVDDFELVTELVELWLERADTDEREDDLGLTEAIAERVAVRVALAVVVGRANACTKLRGSKNELYITKSVVMSGGLGGSGEDAVTSDPRLTRSNSHRILL